MEIEGGTYVERTGDTVGSLLNAWIESVEASASVRPKSLENYKLICNSYLRPYLGEVRLSDVSPNQIDRAYRDLRQRPSKRGGVISPRTVSHAHRTLSEAFRWAVTRGMIPTNPCDRVKSPKAERPEIRVLEPDEMQLILEYLGKHSEWAVVPTILALTTGARRSELLGLTWADINLNSGQISIQRALSQLGDQSVRLEPTKTPKSTRQVALTGWAVTTLKNWLGKQKRKAMLAEITFKQTDPVFSDPPVDKDSVVWPPYLPSSLSQAFSRACKHLSTSQVRLSRASDTRTQALC